MMVDDPREACVKMLEEKKFDKLITGWIRDGEWDEAVLDRAEELTERGELDGPVVDRAKVLLDMI